MNFPGPFGSDFKLQIEPAALRLGERLRIERDIIENGPSDSVIGAIFKWKIWDRPVFTTESRKMRDLLNTQKKNNG